jgi:hypothetical protein
MRTLALILGVLLSFGIAQGQMDLEKAVMGSWNGIVYTRAGAYERTLVIKSVQGQDGKWVVEGAIGRAGAWAPFQGTMETVTGEAVLKLMAGKYPSELTVKDGRRLEGWMLNPENNYKWSAKFERIEKLTDLKPLVGKWSAEIHWGDVGVSSIELSIKGDGTYSRVTRVRERRSDRRSTDEVTGTLELVDGTVRWGNSKGETGTYTLRNDKGKQILREARDGTDPIEFDQ